MKSVNVKTYAKLNFSLEITGVKDGYHLLDSLVASLDLFDSIRLTARKDNLINVYMHGQGSEAVPPEKNAAVKAGELFVEKFGTCGADIAIFKDIPMGGGLGGSSADAAGVLNGMAKLYGITDRAALKELADRLGSDTGYMLGGGFARMTGRGEIVTPLSVCSTLYILLLCPDSPVSTAQCYALFDELNEEHVYGSTQRCIDALEGGRYADMGASFYNSLYAPACRLNGEVLRAVEDLKAFAPLGYGMTGSGSCVFALFENREFCEYAKSRYRGKCRAIITRTIDPRKTAEGVWERLKSPYYLSQEEIEATKE